MCARAFSCSPSWLLALAAGCGGNTFASRARSSRSGATVAGSQTKSFKTDRSPTGTTTIDGVTAASVERAILRQSPTPRPTTAMSITDRHRASEEPIRPDPCRVVLLHDHDQRAAGPV